MSYAAQNAKKHSKIMLVYFDKDLAIAPVIELICQLDFNESPLITLEPTEEELNNEIVIVDTSYNI